MWCAIAIGAAFFFGAVIGVIVLEQWELYRWWSES